MWNRADLLNLLPDRWVISAGLSDGLEDLLISPIYNYVSWGYIREKGYTKSSSVSISEIQQQITRIIEQIQKNKTLVKYAKSLFERFGVCRVTIDSNIEHLNY